MMGTEEKEWYLPQSIICDWNINQETTDILDGFNVKRCYEIWNHALSILNNQPGQFELVDVITTLKRALNKRLKNLDELYKLSTIDLCVGKKHILEKLEKLGIIRPLLIKELMMIRNQIEHDDADPPSNNEVRRLVDVLWYFLRSTDRYVKEKPMDIMIRKEDNDHYWLELKYDIDNNWGIEFRGWVPKELISDRKKDGSLLVKIEKIENNSRFVKDGYHLDKLPTDLCIVGRMIPDDEQKNKLISIYFDSF